MSEDNRLYVCLSLEDKMNLMTRTNISSSSAFENDIGFCRAVRVGDRIVVSGTAPTDANGGCSAPGDMYGQTKRCFEIIQKAIEDAGGELKHVVRTRMMLTDISRWEEAGQAHGEFFKSIKPAATMVEVSGLINPEWLIEIEAEAIIV